MANIDNLIAVLQRLPPDIPIKVGWEYDPRAAQTRIMVDFFVTDEMVQDMGGRHTFEQVALER
jgi:hypothetical protein